ncbi:MAG TPA: KEOPS complex subunit Pcc1 [Candidatus Bilamarchaeaceae archaeon]|nr:KEOPS complex subunit Pcc1 [Candidatus Bilamarchaeaceae archaeon]
MKARIQLNVPFESATDAQAACQALAGESFKGGRVVSEVKSRENSILINIEAEDIVALRAAVNSYLRHVQVIRSVNEVGTNGQ